MPAYYGTSHAYSRTRLCRIAPPMNRMNLTANRALYPRSEHVPGVADTGIEEFLRRYRRESGLLVWIGLVLGTIVFTLSPLITIGVPLPSFLLPRRALDRHACAVAGHRFYLVRQTVFLVKLVAGLCWGADPEVRKRLALPAYPADPGTWRTPSGKGP